MKPNSIVGVKLRPHTISTPVPHADLCGGGCAAVPIMVALDARFDDSQGV